jgi:hypothetical protein
MKAVEFEGVNYAYLTVVRINPANLELIPNYIQKKSAAEMMKTYNCLSGMNGGFYGVDSQPQGLVIVNSNRISREKQSKLLNGFITIDKLFSLNIDRNFSDKAIFGLQTGPMLIYKSQTEELNMERDNQARRMVFGRSNLGEAVFIAVFDPETESMGPSLKDLPDIIRLINEKENLLLTEAINLDGGRASAFYSSEKVLPESDSVGSWWCLRVQ